MYTDSVACSVHRDNPHRNGELGETARPLNSAKPKIFARRLAVCSIIFMMLFELINVKSRVLLPSDSIRVSSGTVPVRRMLMVINCHCGQYICDILPRIVQSVADVEKMPDAAQSPLNLHERFLICACAEYCLHAW